MSIFRKVHVTFWGDPFVQSLTPEQKYFYLYLLTNDRTKQCGIYELTRSKISFDTGYNLETVSKLLSFFIDHDKIRFSDTSNEVAIKNWNKYNGSKSPKVVKCVETELVHVKDKVLIEYLYSMHTASQEEEEENKNKNENKNKDTPAQWLKDLPSSSYLETISGRSGIAMDKLSDLIPKFSKRLKMQYKDHADFLEHFKSWAVIQITNQVIVKPSVEL